LELKIRAEGYTDINELVYSKTLTFNTVKPIDIVSSNKASIDAVKEKIKRIVSVPEVGDVYHGTVKTITAFGAFVEILPGKDGLLHISEIEWSRLKDVESVLKVGDKIDVKLIEVDPKTGKLKLSRKVLLPRPDQNDQGAK
jgi:polyribonucleotide nucleotidyltransferase